MISPSSADQQKIIDILSELVAYPTSYPPGGSSEICAWVARFLEPLGYRVSILSEIPGLDNLVASIGDGAPHLVFNAHVDTVGSGSLDSWETSPFELVRKGGRLYGLGAANCKGSMAAQLWLAEQLARRGGPAKGTVTFTFVTDEESLGPHGMSYLRRVGTVVPDMLLLGAPTSNKLVTAERGVMWVGLETFGTAAHAGAPEDGDNAVLRMVRLVNHLQRIFIPLLKSRTFEGLSSTINVGQFHGGDNTNVVPSHCRVEIDRRLLPSETPEEAFEEIVGLLTESGESPSLWRAELMRGTAGFAARLDGPLIQAARQAIFDVHGKEATFTNAIGASDGRHFAGDGIDILNFGPGLGASGHSANEYVEVEELVESAFIIEKIVEVICGCRS